MTNGEVVIFDIDGTLANNDHRQHHLNGEKKDWDAFFSEQADDDLYDMTNEMLLMFNNEGYEIVLLTGREEKYRGVTERWLQENFVYWDELIMRPTGSRMKDDEWKLKHIKAIEKGGRPVVAIFEDRLRVVKTLRDAGYQVYHVGGGDF